MPLQDGLGDGKPQPGAHLPGVAPAPVVPVKDVGQILRPDARAVVLNFHPAAALLEGDGPQQEHPVLADVVHGVAQQVVQHPLHHGRVGPHRAGLLGFQLQGPAVLCAHRVVPLGHLFAQLGHVKVHQFGLLRAAAHLGKLHYAVHQPAEPVGFVHNDVQLLGALVRFIAGQIAHGLRIAPDEGQRGAQVVAHVGQQLPLQLSRLLHLARHVVEVPRQQAEFVPLALVHVHVVVALGDLPGRGRKLGQRPGDPPAEQPRRQQAEGQQPQCHHGQQLAQHGVRLAHPGQAGRNQNGILPIGGRAAHHHLLGAALGLQNFIQAAVFKGVLPQGNGRGGIPGGGAALAELDAAALVDEAGVQVFHLVDAAQGLVGDVHTALAQVHLPVADALVQPGPEVRVQRQAEHIPLGDDRAVLGGLIELAGHYLQLVLQLFVNEGVVLGLKQPVQAGPHQHQGGQAHQKQGNKQLIAQVQCPLFPLARRFCLAHFAASGSNL